MLQPVSKKYFSVFFCYLTTKKLPENKQGNILPIFPDDWGKKWTFLMTLFFS